jgi:dTMP kinase
VRNIDTHWRKAGRVLAPAQVDALAAAQAMLAEVLQPYAETAPDLTIILDISPDIGLARASRRRGKISDADAFEASDLAFHQLVRAGYLAIAVAEPARCVVIDADQAEAAVAAAIAEVVGKRFGLQVPAIP